MESPAVLTGMLQGVKDKDEADRRPARPQESAATCYDCSQYPIRLCMAMVTVNLTCASCHTTNRVPEERLGDGPRCGKCKQPVLQGRPLELDSGSVNAVLSNNSVPVLVDCWAAWCGPCKAFAPVFAQAAQQLEPRLRCAKLDTEAEPQLAALWQIRSIPTLLLFRGGRESARMSGALPLGQLKQWLQQQGV